MKEGTPLRVEHTNFLEDGSQAYVQMILPEWESAILTSTEEHEAVHAVVGEVVHPGCVEKLSTEPGPGYLGYVQMSFMTAEAAIAPAALHMGGTSHDEGLVAQMGVNPGAAASVARSIVHAHTKEIRSVGYASQKKKTLDGNEVRSAMARVHEAKDAKITKKNPDGTYEIFDAKVENNVVFLESDLLLAA